MSLSSSHPIVFESLRRSAIAFEDNIRTQGFSEFHTVCVSSKKTECGVYEKLWEILKKPIGDAEYGRNAFHDANGKYSTHEQKADAITRYMIVNRMIPSELVRLNEKTNLYSLSNKALKMIDKIDYKISAAINWEPKNPTGKLVVRTVKLTMKIAAICLCIREGARIATNTAGFVQRSRLPGIEPPLPIADLSRHVVVGSGHDTKMALLNHYETLNAARLDALPHDPNYDNPRVNFRHKKQDTREYSCDEEKRHRQKADREANKATNEQGKVIRDAGDGNYGSAAGHQRKAIRHKLKSDAEHRRTNDAMYKDAQDKIKQSREEKQFDEKNGCIVM